MLKLHHEKNIAYLFSPREIDGQRSARSGPQNGRSARGARSTGVGAGANGCQNPNWNMELCGLGDRPASLELGFQAAEGLIDLFDVGDYWIEIRKKERYFARRIWPTFDYLKKAVCASKVYNRRNKTQRDHHRTPCTRRYADEEKKQENRNHMSKVRRKGWCLNRIVCWT